ncbi:MAG: phosphoribosylglycinamide formyltransferase [Candidatus Ranarchaeia archaeon]
MVGVLISGRGTNLQALIDAVNERRIRAKIGCVVSDRPNVLGLERARKAGIPSYVVPHNGYEDRESHEKAILKLLVKHKVELVVLAGYMRLLTSKFVRAYPGAIINIHPALLPSFRGTHAQRQAVNYGVKVSGCTVHFVDEDVDHGPIILQTPVKVYHDDDEKTLAERILPHEHRLIVEAVKLWCEKRLIIEGRKVRILAKPREEEE